MKRKKQQRKTVTIIGLGYVGLPLATLCAEKGYKTYGLSIDRKKMKMINEGINPIKGDVELDKMVARKQVVATFDANVMKRSDIVIICVPTPVDKFYNPDLKPVKSATAKAAQHMKKGQLIIIESTINPGVCEEVVLPILEKGGKKVGKDFYLAHCPERINPGDPKWNVRNIPRVVGAITRRGTKLASAFYSSILEGSVREMKSIKEAEATKIIENSFRDINIAFVNELAKSFDRLGIDVYDVIQGASTKPFAFLAHYPSCGVGGHCIPVDPYYLIERAKQSGFDHRFLRLAREINNSMPSYTVNQLIRILNELGKSVKGTPIGILGLSYKADVGDIRESPSLKIIELLKNFHAEVNVYDPYFPDESTVKSLDALLKKSEAVILAAPHKEFISMDLRKLKKNGIKVVIDGQNAFDKRTLVDFGIRYKGIGR
ncbi:nucleotide sugar dehydrogenase [Patescibacteria group bacterium]